MRHATCAILLVALLTPTVAALAGENFDPDAALARIEEWYQDRLAKENEKFARKDAKIEQRLANCPVLNNPEKAARYISKLSEKQQKLVRKHLQKLETIASRYEEKNEQLADKIAALQAALEEELFGW